jgi:hypothetical protein
MNFPRRPDVARVKQQAPYLLKEEGMLDSLDRRLQYGSGLRAQRAAEASLLVMVLFTGDLRFAYVALGFFLLQAISPRLVPAGLLVASIVPDRRRHAVGDLYFDLAGNRGSCAIAALTIAGAIALVHSGLREAGFLLLALPTAGAILAPAVGFCPGVTTYVLIREAFARIGLLTRYPHGACDVDVDREEAAHGN